MCRKWLNLNNQTFLNFYSCLLSQRLSMTKNVSSFSLWK
jgi:hypothetical protein